MDKKRNGKSSDLLRRALAMLLAFICSVYMLPGPALVYAVGETADMETVTNENAEETAEGTDGSQEAGEETAGQNDDAQETGGETAGETDAQEETDVEEGAEAEEATEADDASTDETAVDEEEEELEEEPAVLLKSPLRAAGTPDTIDMAKQGITVNIFDYGPASIDSGWSNTTRAQNEQGINSGKTLKFFSNGLEHGAANAFPQNQDYNNWTGSPDYNTGKGAAANQGIVKNTLDNDGYPELAVGGKEDLKYLFDPETSNSNRKDYLGVNGLLYKDGNSASGYMVKYACGDYYARMNESTREMTLSSPYYCLGNEESGPIGFFPFNDPNTSKTQVSGANMNTNGGYYNHHFGMTMEAEFAITEDGQLGGEDMTFEFAGDDDMWVFVDGVLVLDIGGIHQPVAGKINFKDGTVSMREAPIYDGTHGGAEIMSAVQSVSTGERKQATNGQNSYYYNTAGNQVLVQGGDMTLAHIFELAGKTWDPSPYKKHTIQAFYLERGGMYSNLDISMNLLTTKDIEVEKGIVDKNGNAVTDLTDYYADDNDKYKFKVFVQKEGDPNAFFAYNGESNTDGDKSSHTYEFGGYDVYEDGNKMDDEAKPKFSSDGVIELKRNQKVRIKSIPYDYKYYVQEVEVDESKFSDTKIDQTTLDKTESDGKYSVESGKLIPEETQITKFDNVAIEKKVPHKNETAPYKGNDEKIPDPADAAKTVDNAEGQLGVVQPGDEITYEISYANTTTKTQKVTITDVLDANVKFISATKNGVNDNGTVKWAFDAPAGEEGVVKLVVEVKDSAKSVGKVVNPGASVKVGNYDAVTTESVTNPVPDPHKNETDPDKGNDSFVPDPSDDTKTVANEKGELGAVKVGDEITYEISYKNYKKNAATIVIEDTLDSNVEFVEASDSGAHSGNKVTWTLSDVAAGKSGTVTLKVKVKDSAAAAGSVSNGASVKVGNDSAFDTETVTNPVTDQHKEEMSPFTGDGLLGPVKVGDTIEYKISYKNYKSEAADVTITDVLDKNVEFVSATENGANNNGTVTWTIKNVPAKGTGFVTLKVKVLEGAKTSGEVSNSAKVQIGNDDAYDTETVTNPVPDPHKKETAPYEGTGHLGLVKPGDTITYEISYKNYKAEKATVTITDKLDKNVEFVEASNNGTNSEGTVTWNLENVPAGEAGSVTLKVKVKEDAKSAGEVVNEGAKVKVGDDPEFNTESVTNPVPDPHKTETSPDEGNDVTKADLKPVQPGEKITYKIDYKNYQAKAADVVIEDVLDSNVKFVSASNGGALTAAAEAGGTVRWTLKDVAAGTEGSVTLTVEVLEGAKTAGIVKNEGASVKVGNDAAFNTESVTNPVPDPHKNETAPYKGNGELGAVKVGEDITYEISYKNYKSTEADIVITDTLDENVTFKEASAPGSEKDGTVTWTLPKVQPGVTGTVTLTVTVKDGAKGKTIANTAKVKVGNDAAFDTEEVTNPVPEDPEKAETAPYKGKGELGSVKAGDSISYNIKFKNYKSKDADVKVTDKLDSKVEFVSADQGGTYDEATHTVTWTVPTAANTEGSVTLTVKVKSDVSEGAVVENGAKVQIGNEPEFYTNTITNPVPVLPHKTETAPDEGTGLLKGVNAGDEISYEISYKNYRASNADVTISDKLDPNVTFVSADNGGKNNNGTVEWTIADVAAGAEGKVTLTVKVKDGVKGELINNQADVQVGNDPSNKTEVVTNPTTTDPVKTEPSPGEGNGVKPGDVVTYNISYRNYRPETATVIISDKLDKNVEYVEDSAGENSVYDSEKHTITWNIPDVPAKDEEGSSGTVSFKVEVKESARTSKDGPGKIANGASVKVGNDDAVDTNIVENPVPEDPVKKETSPYEGNGKNAVEELGAVKVGEDITYEISYKNYKKTAADIVITDELDANVKFKEASDDGALVEAAEAGGVVKWTLTGIEPDEEGTVTLTVTVLKEAGTVGKVSNQAKVNVDNDGDFVTNTTENPVPEDPVKKETKPYEGTGEGTGDDNIEELGAVKVGDDITYTISYKNYKSTEADIVITDKLDENVTFKEASDDGAEADGTVTWTLPKVQPGASGTVTLAVTVLDDAKTAGKVRNQATVKVGNDTSYDTNIEENPVPEDPHKKETAPYEGNGELGGVQPGQEITYEISYRNYKSTAATVVVTDKLDPNVEVVSPGGGVEGDGKVTWTIENVAAGEEGTVSLIVKVKDEALDVGSIVNGANVKVGNDKDYDTETVTNPVTEGPHKNETEPYEGNGELGGVKPGEQITYEISYKNYKSTAADVTISDTLDENVKYISSDPEGSRGFLNLSDTVTWKIKDVQAGEEGTVTLTVEVKDSALESNGGPGKVENSAKVQIGNDDEFDTETVTNPVPEDPEKVETAPYEGKGELGGVKPGETITYQIKYKNYKSTAADVKISDKLDEKVVFADASNDGKETDGTVNWTIENVPAGAEGTVTLTVTVKSDAPKGTIISNSAKVKVGNDSEFETNEITNPLPEDPHKAETAPGEGTGILDGVESGDEISYKVTYKNYKSETADVAIRDPLDPNVTFVKASDGGSEKDGEAVWTIRNVKAGEEGEVTLTVKVNDDVKGIMINNQAFVTVGNDSEYSTETVSNPTTTDPVKAETKPGEDMAVRPGDTVEYEIAYTNYRPNVSDVTVTDELDENVEFVSADNDGKYDEETHTITWVVKDVPKYEDEGCSGKVGFSVKVKDSALVSNEGPGRIVNEASVRVGNDKAVKTNKVENPVPEDPVKSEKTPGEKKGVKPGDEIKYEISYENYKKTTADVLIADLLDEGVDYVSAEPADEVVYDKDRHSVAWLLLDTPAGEKGKVSLTVKVNDKAKADDYKVINSAKVNVGNDPDYSTGIIENPVPEDPVKKEISPYEGSGEPDVEELGSVKPGDTVEYEVSYRNYKDKAADVVITDKLDSNVEFVSASDDGEFADGTVTWTIKDVGAGEAGTVTLKVKVLDSAAAAGKIANQAKVNVDNDGDFDTNIEENPVPEDPTKKESAPYKGSGELGAVKAGDTVTYEITYRNYKSTAADVTITDELDKNVKYVSSEPEGSRGLLGLSDTVTWKIKDVPAGEEGTVTLTVEVKDSALESNGGPGKIENSARVKIGNDAEYETDTVTNPVPEDPEKAETAPYEGKGELGGVKPGDTVTYRVSYKNYKSTAADVKISDKLDEKVTFSSASDNGTEKDGTVSWNIENVPAGGEGAVTLTVEVKADAPKGTLISNKAEVQVGNDAVYETNEVTNPLPEDPHKAETAPDKGTGLLAGVNEGDEITYEITYRNYKSEKADVTITDPVDKDAEFVSASDGGKEEGGTVTWKISNVGAGEEGKVTLTIRVKDGVKGELIDNQAHVAVGDDPAYDTETVTNPTTNDPVKTEPVPGAGTAVRIGEEVTYEVSYSNYRPEASDVIITDELDKNVEFVSADNSGRYDAETHTIKWTLSKVPAAGSDGSAGKVSCKVKVLESAMKSADGPGKIENEASVKVGNDKAVKTNKVENPVPESPVKTEPKPGEDAGVRPGDKIDYEISYENYKSEASDVVITDRLDENLAYVSSSDDGTEKDGTVTWVIKNVPAGSKGSVSLKVEVLDGAKAAGLVSNTADVQVGHDPVFRTNTIENPVPEYPHKEEISPDKGTGLLSSVSEGDEITYKISFRNYKKTAADVTITDPLDPNVEFVSAGNGGELKSGKVVWTIKNVAAGTTGEVTLTVRVKDGVESKLINNQASVAVGNDSSFDTEVVSNPTTSNPVKTEPRPGAGKTVRVGDTVTYQISWCNYRPDAETIVITDELDENVKFVSASDGGKYNKSTHTVVWTLSDVPGAGEDGYAGKVTLKVEVLKGAVKEGMIENQASVKVGNDPAIDTDIIENPVKDNPHKVPDTGDSNEGLLYGAVGMLAALELLIMRRKRRLS